MLELINIKKNYKVAGEEVPALKGISLRFRKNEFVSILGASGCGKTTLLNIIGGLDQYTSGDLLIEGRSTKNFSDRDWDTYRNHSIGFIFQSYHLIPHQTILQNVELALMIGGVSKRERRQRAIEALEKVGLGDKINNRPNQLSGGQAQRVAIARALINNPEIVLADEPTGALDSKTSVQIMELLKEISKDRLVIMVTHNPELAEQYSTRIIRLLDGLVVGDTYPYHPENVTVDEVARAQKEKKKGSKKHSSMSIGMAMGLSGKNLLSKRKRTAMVSVAGSIGIIGVSLVLAISSGVTGYIAAMENDMLSGYPLTIRPAAVDYSVLTSASENAMKKVNIKKLKNQVYVDSLLQTLMGFSKSTKTNNITDDYVAYVDAMPEEYYNAIQKEYSFDINNYIFTDFKVTSQSQTEGVDGLRSITGIRSMYKSVLDQVPDYAQYSSMISTMDAFQEMPNNYEYILSQYDILACSEGEISALTNEQLKTIFEDKTTLAMVVSDNETSDLLMGEFAYLTQEEFLNYAYYAANGTDDGSSYDPTIGLIGVGDKDGNGGLPYSTFIGETGKKFHWYSNDTIYTQTPAGTMEFDPATMSLVPAPYTYNSMASAFQTDRDTSKDLDLAVKVILQKKKNISYGCLRSGFYYTKALTDYTLQTAESSAIVNYMNAQESKSLPVLSYKFSYHYNGATFTNGKSYVYDQSNAMSNMMSAMMSGGGATSISLSAGLDVVAGNKTPSSLKIYPSDFDTKTLVTNYLDHWNDVCEGEGTLTYGDTTVTGLTEADKITYTDTVGLIIGMVNTMIQAITIALICFTALSLVVSTVMISIITYVSVVERIKEIGILRAVGARKKDIKRLFNSETFIIGLTSGLFGIGVTYLLSLIINIIVRTAAGLTFAIAALPLYQAGIMIVISVLLTLIAGLIPASAAAKKDPVVALRTE